jgi:GR25 family glycosyltransferase involved in LPS biosynthesis
MSMPSQPIRAFCICLPEDPNGIERARKHFTESGLDRVEFFFGINAPLAGLATWHPYEVDHPGSGFKMGAKPTGCWLSHWMLWNALMHYNEGADSDLILVLEQDARLHDGFVEHLTKALKDTPSDAAFLHVGHCCIKGKPAEHVAGNVYRCKGQQCTHAYVVRRNVLPLVCRTIRKCWAPIDIQLQMEVFPHVAVYAVIPRIASQFDTELAP